MGATPNETVKYAAVGILLVHKCRGGGQVRKSDHVRLTLSGSTKGAYRHRIQCGLLSKRQNVYLRWKCLYMLTAESNLAHSNLCNLIRAHVLVDCRYNVFVLTWNLRRLARQTDRHTHTLPPTLLHFPPPPLPFSAGYRGCRNLGLCWRSREPIKVFLFFFYEPGVGQNRVCLLQLLPRSMPSYFLLSSRCQKNRTLSRGSLLTFCVRVPNDAQFARLWRTRAEIRPLQVFPVRGVDPLSLLVRGVFTLENFVQCVSLKKCEFLPFVTKQLCPCSRNQPTSTSKLLLLSVVRSWVHYT